MMEAAKVPTPSPAHASQPDLVVDLDGSLLRSDTLMEGIVAGLFQKPLATLGRLALAVFSRPAFKAWVYENIKVDYEAIPVNDRLLAYLRGEKRAGRKMHLVSAADQSVVDVAAERFGIFDSATGSSGAVNLKGRRKLDFIRETIGSEFVYVGDSEADLAVWGGAKGAIYAGTNAGLARRLSKSPNGLEQDFSRAQGGLKTWLKALRLHQWSKNVLIFLPLVLAHLYTDVPAIAATLFAFLVMGVTASGTYLLNDLSDLSSDRRHRTKRQRPLASARVSVVGGLFLAIGMVGGGLALAVWLSLEFAAVLMAYVGLTLAYSLSLKRTPILDIFVLASLYTLRLVIGTVVIGSPFSLWLITFSMFFFFSLALAKRHVEVSEANARPGLLVRGRGYYPEDAPLTLVLGLASGTASILVLVLYLVNEAYAAGVYPAPGFLAAIPLLVGMWTMRIWLLAHRGRLHDDPVSFAVRDPKSLVMGTMLAGALGAAMLVPASTLLAG